MNFSFPELTLILILILLLFGGGLWLRIRRRLPRKSANDNAKKRGRKGK